MVTYLYWLVLVLVVAGVLLGDASHLGKWPPRPAQLQTPAWIERRSQPLSGLKRAAVYTILGSTKIRDAKQYIFQHT